MTVQQGGRATQTSTWLLRRMSQAQALLLVIGVPMTDNGKAAMPELTDAI